MGILEGSNREVSIIKGLPIVLRKGKRLCVEYPISQYVCTDNLSNIHQIFVGTIVAIKIPTSIQEAMRSEHWTQAMKEGMDALKRNLTWMIVYKPRDKNAMWCRWIFTVKDKEMG